MARTALLIIGMHRAGTSALARVCSLRGAALPAHVLPPNSGNVRGYWEPQGVIDLNDRILDHYDLSWDDPFAPSRLPPPAAMPSRFIDEAKRVIEQEYAAADLFVMKDPRCTLLHGFWRGALESAGIRVATIVMMRPWREVVDSLVRRDRTDPVSGALLYVAYGLQAADTRATGASFVTYRQLIADWRAATERLADEQRFAWPDAGAAGEQIQAFLQTPAETPEIAGIPDALCEWAAIVADWHERAAAGESPPATTLHDVETRMAHLGAVLAPLLADRKRTLRETRAARDASIQERDTVLAIHRTTEERLRGTQADYERLDQAFAKRNEEYVAALARADDARAELASVRADAQGVRQQLDLVLGSRSWKLTAPLRHVLRVLRKQAPLLPTAVRRPAADHLAAVTQPHRPQAGLQRFLEAEFDAATASEVLDRIARYRLPIPTQDTRVAMRTECTQEQGIAWAGEIARLASGDDGADAPDVSIVIPVYNQAPFTLACIDALLQHRSRYRFEILIGDDGSTDATEAALATPLPRVRHVRHPQNLGFVRNCNATAAQARGRHLVFLNNDTLVLPGWLDELIDTLEANADIGLVGSKLLYPDGRLQECGAIVWRDGSAWNYGRLADPRRPEFCYRRDVDYVSGASIALGTALWTSLGGFDEAFVPAYAEDADLAFRVRSRGLRTVVQPLSQLLHFEGISSGTDLGAGAKAYQVENLRKLHARWATDLETHRDNAVQPELEKERSTRRRALFVDHCTPSPNEDAGSLVAFEVMLAFIANGYKVTFVPEDNFAHVGAHTRDLQRIGIEAIYHPAYSSMSSFLAARSDPYDVIFLHRFGVADAHLDALRRAYPDARIVFLNADLHYLREMREAELASDAKALARAKLTRERELRAIAGADVALVHSEHEHALLHREIPDANVAVFPLVHEPAPQVAPLAAREGVCFVGGFRHPPNADGIRWFVDAVWPRVIAQRPQARLYVVGSHVTPEVRALGEVAGVQVVGYVEDLDAFLDRRRVSVAPLRYGAGAKGKVAGSLARGLPTVCTPIAAEGMGLEPGVDVLLAEDPDALADHVVRLLGDDAEWQRLSQAGLAYAHAVTSRASAHARLRRVLGLATASD